jgi:hypothetical protein
MSAGRNAASPFSFSLSLSLQIHPSFTLSHTHLWKSGVEVGWGGEVWTGWFEVLYLF